MSTSNVPKFELTLSAAPDDVTIVVLDRRNQPVWKDARGGDTRLLPAGYYTVRASRGANFEETVIRLSHEDRVEVPEVARYSAAPVSSSSLSHEYYEGPSATFSATDTTQLRLSSAVNTGRIFLFVRAVDETRSSTLRWLEDLRLILPDGIEVPINRRTTKFDAHFGWSALSCQTQSGFHCLVTNDGRKLGAHVFPSWQTQVFVIHDDERVILESASILMAPMFGRFDSHDPLVNQMDLGLDALQFGAGTVPKRSLDMLLNGKYENPLAGLIGAYLLLAELRAAESPGDFNATKWRMEYVIANLLALVPDSADLYAIRLIFHLYASGPKPKGSLRFPPMVRQGYEAVIRQNAKTGDLVEDGSIADLVAERIRADCVWTMWSDDFGRVHLQDLKEQIRREAPMTQRALRLATKWVMSIAKDTVLTGAIKIGLPDELQLPEKIPAERQDQEDQTLNWVEAALLELAADAVSARRRRTKKTRRTSKLDVESVALKLGVTPKRIRRALQTLDGLQIDDLNREFSRTLRMPAGAKFSQIFAKLGATPDS